MTILFSTSACRICQRPKVPMSSQSTLRSDSLALVLLANTLGLQVWANSQWLLSSRKSRAVITRLNSEWLPTGSNARSVKEKATWKLMKTKWRESQPKQLRKCCSDSALSLKKEKELREKVTPESHTFQNSVKPVVSGCAQRELKWDEQGRKKREADNSSKTATDISTYYW